MRKNCLSIGSFPFSAFVAIAQNVSLFCVRDTMNLIFINGGLNKVRRTQEDLKKARKTSAKFEIADLYTSVETQSIKVSITSPKEWPDRGK